MLRSITKPGRLQTLAAVLLFLAVPACGSGEPEDGNGSVAEDEVASTEAGASGGGGILRVREGGDISGFDPASLFQRESQTAAGHVFNGLLKYDEASNELVEDLAESYEVSDDGLVYTFKLREGVQFHKGYGELTAEDVIFSFERIKDPDTGSRYASEVANIESVSALDDYTVEFQLGHPNANFLHTVAAFNQGLIVSKAAVEELGEDFNLNPVGTGPFVFERYVPGDSLLLLANEDYFEGRPTLDGVEFRVIPEETAAEVALTQGEIDVLLGIGNPEVVNRLEEDPNIEVHVRTSSFTTNIALNLQRPPLDDVRVRQALAHGLNREALQEDFYQGLRGWADTPLTPAFLEYTSDVPTYPYDPERARQLLDEAEVESFDFEITVPALEPYSDMVVLLQSDLNALGINATVNIVERAEFGAVRAEGNLDSSLVAIISPPNPDAPLRQIYHSSARPPGMNLGAYDGVDALLDEAQAIQDDEERKAAYAEVQRKVAEDLPVIPLHDYQLVAATRSNVAGYVQNSYYTFNAYPISLGEPPSP